MARPKKSNAPLRTPAPVAPDTVQEDDSLPFKVAFVRSRIVEKEDVTTLPNGKQVKYTDTEIPLRNLILTVYKPRIDQRTKVMVDDPITENLPVPFRTDNNIFTRDHRVSSEEVLRSAMSTPAYGDGRLVIIPILKEQLEMEKQQRKNAMFQQQVSEARTKLADNYWTGIPDQQDASGHFQPVGLTDAPSLSIPA